MKVLFWVQHLLGIGHVTRAALLTDAMTRAGLKVTVAFGGRPVANIPFPCEVRYLPAIEATDQTFSKLVAVDGAPLKATLAERRERLVALTLDLRPDIVLIEAWPFGRRGFSGEVEAMIDAARGATPGAFTAISVRDILQTKRKRGRTQETRERLERCADMVLVHSDPRVVRLETTFPAAAGLAVPVVHSGYVAAPSKVVPSPAHDIVVTAGGGAFGGPLMRAAAEAAALMPDRHWLLSLGPNGGSMRPQPTANLEVVDYLAPLANHLAGAQLSISQAGYNTVTDVLRAQAFGTRAVLVPSDVTGQTEQLSRAKALAKRGAAICLPESKLTAKALAKAVRDAPAPPVHDVRFDGAARSAALLREAPARAAA